MPLPAGKPPHMNYNYYPVLSKQDMANKKKITPESLEQDIEAFLNKGGKIQEIEQGLSGIPFNPKRTKDETKAAKKI